MKPIWPKLPWTAKEALKEIACVLLKIRQRWAGDAPDVVFLLGHMRSGSTLLLHVLLTHPAILGYGERNAPYTSAKDLDRLHVDTRYQRRQFFQSYRYLVDQINHTRFLASEAMLNHARLCKIFLIREPEASLASMVEVLGHFYGMTVEAAAAYYIERLETLARYGQGIEDKTSAFFLTYEDLTRHPASTLRSLQTFLGLETALSAYYRRFDFTGTRGDPSETIHSGRILQDKARRHVDLDPDVLLRTRTVYDDCRAILTAHCQSIEAAYDP